MPSGGGEGRAAMRMTAEQVERVSVEEARREVEAGRALLVCAYDDESKCRQMRLGNAIALHDLQRRIESVPHNQTLIFYCA
jgi:hypothetical protein